MSVKTKRLILPLLMVFLFLGCTTSSYTHTIYEPQVGPSQVNSRLITIEGIDIAELTSDRFRMFVFYERPFIELRLIIPQGEELFMEESNGNVLNSETQQKPHKFELDWFRVASSLSKLNIES